MTKTLKDYRPQHDEDCTIEKCSVCGHVRGLCLYCQRGEVKQHGFTPSPCSCGLEALLSGEGESRRENTEKDSCAALLPADPSAAVTTETLPNDDTQLCPTCGTALDWND